MSNLAIEAEQLSKRFRIGEENKTQDTLAAAMVQIVKRPLQNFRRLRELSKFDDSSTNEPGVIWALKDVSFKIKHGEAVGIMGHNGAGKSTLLKILSRITPPTSGRATIHGRVSSLLEVGTGFHPELTGRENVYLNAAILGMTRSDVARKFDAIVQFAGEGVERFLDTPLKRYSSGMQVRLAFAVAAHLEPEILIVDEVLAVGDVEFQAKCVGKMEEVASEGRTVLLVSHNLGAIANLCDSGMWIDDGRLRMQGQSRDLIRAYLQSNSAHLEADSSLWKREGNGEARLQRIRVLNTNEQMCDAFPMGETIIIDLDIEFMTTLPFLDISVGIQRLDLGVNVLDLYSGDSGFVPRELGPGVRRFRLEIPHCSLYPALFGITVELGSASGKLDDVRDVARFSTVQSSVTRRTTALRREDAVFLSDSRWCEIDVSTDGECEGAFVNDRA